MNLADLYKILDAMPLDAEGICILGRKTKDVYFFSTSQPQENSWVAFTPAYKPHKEPGDRWKARVK